MRVDSPRCLSYPLKIEHLTPVVVQGHIYRIPWAGTKWCDLFIDAPLQTYVYPISGRSRQTVFHLRHIRLLRAKNGFTS